MSRILIAIIVIVLLFTTCSKEIDSNLMDRDFIGTWKLEKWTSTLSDGSEVYPFGEKAYGKLIYEPNGEMTGLFMAADRQKMSSADVRERIPEEALEAFNSFFAYSGPYEINRDSSFVLHHVEACSNPNWVGATQRRIFAFNKDKLILSTPPIAVQGTQGQARSQQLIWTRSE